MPHDQELRAAIRQAASTGKAASTSFKGKVTEMREDWDDKSKTRITVEEPSRSATRGEVAPPSLSQSVVLPKGEAEAFAVGDAVKVTISIGKG